MRLNNILTASLLTAGSMLSACSNEIEMRYPPKYVLPELEEVGDIHTFKAPLYWSVYEYCYEKEQAGEQTIDISEEEWDKIIDWVARDLKPHGYDMVCTDGFCAMLAKDDSGYMTHYGSMKLSDLVAKCEAKGLTLGVYDNPLWIHGADNTPINGTNFRFGGLKWDGASDVRNADAEDKWFQWAVADYKGAKEFIDGFFQHYKNLGVKYIRMDFLSWYEDGYDRGYGTVSRGYGRANYAFALNMIAQSAKEHGIFTSLVMPHLYNDAELEAQYGNMIRIVCDTAGGGWWHTSEADRGVSYTNWPNCMNQFDGFVYWSHLAGKGKVILDGDFLRLNKFSTEAEKQFAVSLQLMAGGPVTVADQYHNIGNNLQYYVNDELLALNADRFVGHPISDSLIDQDNQTWFGQMSNGDYVLGIFNRENSSKSINIDLGTLGINGAVNVRDLWRHADEGTATVISANIPAHGCKIVRLTRP